MAAVEVKNLGKTHGHVVAVDDLSFTIEHGEEFALLVPNGAGKSTAVRSPVATSGPLTSRSGPHSDPPKRRAAEMRERR